MKFFLPIVLLLIFSFRILSGQDQSKADSLRKVLDTQSLSDQERARLLLNLAYYCNPVEGIRYGNQALELSVKLGMREYEAIAWEYIGTKNRVLGNNLLAVQAQINASGIYRDLGMNDKEAIIYSLLGTNFVNDNDYDSGVNYLKKALDFFCEQKDSARIAVTLSNIGEAFRKNQEPDSAESYFLKAYALAQTFTDQEHSALISGNLGMLHFARGNYPLARKELQKAIDFYLLKENVHMVTVFNSELAGVMIAENQEREGEKLLLESLEMAKEAHMKEQIRDICLKLSKYYEEEKKFVPALRYYKQYKLFADSLADVENVRKMEQQLSKFALSQKEEEIDNLNRINRLQRWLSFTLASGVVVFILFSFFLYRANLWIRKTNKLLSEQKQMVEQREKEKALLLKELNHRVKNNLQMVASLLNLQSRQLKGHPAAEALTAGKLRVEALTLIHQKLYRDDVDTAINIREYIEELAKNLVLNFGQEFQLNLDLRPVVIGIDKAIPLGLILNELITNSLKYGKEGLPFPALSIRMQEQDHAVVIQISDNGPGLPDDFDWKKSASFGLRLVHSLVAQLNGKIEYQKEKGSNWLVSLNVINQV
ncbi:MAG TPA: histidine kinase dimerization/phosphoacceptor domain -containing protein [Prolixibacteraceae bacterium]|nr:histidine kinase dimerization/phosphoacceptor domain -containing protein [Prolixibacteraceae bacterium]